MLSTSFDLRDPGSPLLFEGSLFEHFPNLEPPNEESRALGASPSPLLLPISPEEKQPEDRGLKRKTREEHKRIDLSAILNSPYATQQQHSSKEGGVLIKPAHKYRRTYKKPHRIDVQAILHPSQSPEEILSSSSRDSDTRSDSSPKTRLQPPNPKGEAVPAPSLQPLWQCVMPTFRNADQSSSTPPSSSPTLLEESFPEAPKEPSFPLPKEQVSPHSPQEDASIPPIVQAGGQGHEHLPVELKNPLTEALEAIEQDPRATPRIKEDRSYVLQLAQTNPLALQSTKPGFFFDLEIFLAGIRKNYEFLEYAPDSLLHNKGYMLIAVRENGYCLRFAKGVCAKDPDLVLEALRQNFSSIRYAAKELFQSREFFLKAIEIDPATLCYNDELKGDKDFVINAVHINPKALLYAALSLRKDIQFLRTVVQEDIRAFTFACSSARTNAEFVISLMKKNPTIFFYIDATLRKSPEFLLKAMKETLIVVQCMEESLKKDKSLQQKIVEQDGLALQYLNSRWHSDPDIVLAAVLQNKDAYTFAKGAARIDPTVCKALKET